MYFCRLELVLNGECLKFGSPNLDQQFIEDVKLFLLRDQFLDVASESAFSCSGRKQICDDEARFVFKLKIINKEVFEGSRK